jgi:hypothetical protein
VIAVEALAAHTDEEWRKAVADSLSELVKATQALREQNASFQATYTAHYEDTQRRLEKLEDAKDALAEKAEARHVSVLQRQIDLDWKIMAIAASLIGNALQLLGGHLVWHW